MKFGMTSGTVAQLILLVLVMMLVCTSACFIRNCPMGGKRALEEMTGIPTQRKCLRCGPLGMGQCIGPNICCGNDIGCFINTKESGVCEKENYVSTPCEVEGEICGENGQGNCVADSVCCTDEQCRLDSQCHQNSHSNQIPTAIQLLQKLILHQKSYVDRR